MSFLERYTTSRTDSDEVLGEYPFLRYKHLFVTRNNINLFFKQLTHINGVAGANLNQEERETVDNLETLIRTKLCIVTVSLSYG